MNPTHPQMVRALFKPGEDIRSSLSDLDCQLIHAVFGISGEAGELLDAVKKAVIYRQEINIQHVVEELGDLEFFLEALRQCLQISREETLEANITKLSIRYPEFKYSDHCAKERFDKKPQ